MNEAEWLTCDSPKLIIEYLEARAYGRKLRLFAGACCRRIWKYLKRKDLRLMVEVSERYADGLATNDELDAADRKAGSAFAEVQWAAESDVDTNPARAAQWLAKPFTYGVAEQAAATFAAIARDRDYKSRQRKRTDGQPEPWEQVNNVYREAEFTEEQHQLLLLKDIFGNPFRPVAFDPSWRTTTVVALAQQMYDSRDFMPMPILADALQDAGCENVDILAHCRGEGPHVRGCWVVDLVLGKE